MVGCGHWARTEEGEVLDARMAVGRAEIPCKLSEYIGAVEGLRKECDVRYIYMVK
jgi:hypothetical protein